MSYREARNLAEILRSLGFYRIVSIENFRTPNFKLVAEIIYWFINRFDPNANISDNIEEEQDRVDFIVKACKFFYSNLKIKINLKKLYASDSACIPELLKIAELFYNAKSTTVNENDIDFTTELDLSSKEKELKDLKELSSSIVESGLSLLEMLEKEKVIRSSRDKAIEFLDNLMKGGDSKKEKEQIEKKIISILQAQQETLDQLDTHIEQLKQKESDLDEELKMKQNEYSRLSGLRINKPKQDDEQLQLEAELQHIFKLYVDKMRNNDYLEHKMEYWNEIITGREKRVRTEIKELIKQDEIEKEKAYHDGQLSYNYNDTQKQKERDQLQTRFNQKNNNFSNFDEEDEDQDLDGEDEAAEDDESDDGFRDEI